MGIGMGMGMKAVYDVPGHDSTGKQRANGTSNGNGVNHRLHATAVLPSGTDEQDTCLVTSKAPEGGVLDKPAVEL